MAKSLDELLDYLDGLEDRAALPELTAHLHELRIDDELDAYMLFSERGYTRNLVRGTEHYNLLVLCWRNGQRSPIHDHKGSACAMRVLHGVMTETIFTFAPNGQVKATRSDDHATGCVQGNEDMAMHQVSNLQEGDRDLITLHIYSPPLLWMGTYSLTDRSRGQEPMFLEFSEAAGI